MAIERLFERFCEEAGIAAMQREWAMPDAPRRPLYYRALDFLERRIDPAVPDPELITLQRRLFLDLEDHFASQGEDLRHSFMVVIPVADRPRHLQACLASLLQQCRRFRYGGQDEGHFKKIRVLVADDSRQGVNVRRIREIAAGFDRMGLPIHYFGQDEQRRTVQSLPGDMAGIIGNPEQSGFQHKGASVMRNIAYLKLRDSGGAGDRQLFLFIDSDQEFVVDSSSSESGYRPNYFYYLDRIFSESDVQVLTGKVVGDPPVSPSVMGGNLLCDLIAFMTLMAGLDPLQTCGFHTDNGHGTDEASYHDMADLFGFRPADDAFRYPCPLRDEHDHRAAFDHFAGLLGRFFDGEHPTRKTRYLHGDVLGGVTPARTVYTGNYVLKPQALRFFIPFAPLKLRMAGPVLGRLIRVEVGPGFVSANLPMLHRRTVGGGGRSEFRPDIHRRDDAVDLSGELERQYFGDVMLFSVEQLTDSGFPARTLCLKQIAGVVQAIERELHGKYLLKREGIQVRLQQLRSIFGESGHWWNQLPEMRHSRDQVKRFIDDMERNFGEQAPGYRLIQNREHKQGRLQAIAEAIAGYPDDRKAWESLLNK